MTITWQEAITPVTQAEYVDQNLAALEDAGSSINGWSPDAPQRALVEGESRAETAESEIIAGLAKTASTATVVDAGDSWVDAAMTWFDVVREPATYAIWSIPFVTNAPPSTVDSSTPQIVVQANDGTYFLCSQQSAVQYPTTLTVGYLSFRARETGDGGNVSVGSITKIVSGPSELEIVPNGEATHFLVTPARNEETSAAFIARGIGRWGVIGPSTDSALGSAGWTRTSMDYLIPLFGAAEGVTRWSVDDANPFGPGTVGVTLASEAGVATSAAVDAVDAGLNGLSVKPVGSGEITVASAVEHALVLTATIQTDGSILAATIKAAAESALTILGQKFPLGISKLVPDLVREVLMGAALAQVTIQTGTTSEVIDLDLPGFASVEEILSLSLTTFEIIGAGEVLVITPTVTVLG